MKAILTKNSIKVVNYDLSDETINTLLYKHNAKIEVDNNQSYLEVTGNPKYLYNVLFELSGDNVVDIGNINTDERNYHYYTLYFDLMEVGYVNEEGVFIKIGDIVDPVENRYKSLVETGQRIGARLL